MTITTNGYNFFCQGTFTNNGTIVTGPNNSGNTPTAGPTSYPLSYGGSGGGGNDGGGSEWQYGGNTLAAGGGQDVNGSTPPAPTLTSSDIVNMYSSGIAQYLEGAGGGATGLSGSIGQSGSYGIFINANTLIAGTINTSSANAATSGGAGGAGAILLVYGSGGYTAGTYNISGGAALSGGGAGGGDGQVILFGGNPISALFSNFSYTASEGMINRFSSYSYAAFSTSSTSPISISSQSFTPLHSGLVTIRAVVSISNNTIGDGVEVGLYNGSTLLDSDVFTQEGLASNTHEITLYTEQLFTSPFSIQTYSIQINAVTGGTATAEIQQFEINEVF